MLCFKYGLDNILKSPITGSVLLKSILEIAKPNINSIKLLSLNLCKNESKTVNKIESSTFKNFNSIEELIFKSTKTQDAAIMVNDVVTINYKFYLKSNVELIQSVNKLTSLKVLSLINCGIDDISENFYLGSPFISLVNLTNLDLSSNKIKNLNRKCFEGLFKLKSLNLCDNEICLIKDSPFDYLESLESLNLSNNPITRLCWHSFGKQLNQLKQINLLNCPFDFIEYNTFKHLVKLIGYICQSIL